jgi:hypothetical protein
MRKRVSLFDFYLAANKLHHLIQDLEALGMKLEPGSEIEQAASLVRDTLIEDIDKDYAAAELKLDAAHRAANVRDQMLMEARDRIEQALEVRSE